MANDFTASVIPILRAKMDTIFKSKATVNSELTVQPVAATVALEKQTVSLNPLKAGAGDLCTGVRVLYSVADDTDAAAVSTTPISSTCSLTTGDTLSTAYQDYDFNFFSKQAVLVNDKDCDNFVKFMDRSAFLLGHKMSMMVQAFNNTVINTLETNKSTATAANLPDDVTVDATTGEYTITSTASKDFWTGLGAADTLAIFDQLARVKGLPNNYYIISGKALRVSAAIAKDHAANDNEKSYEITFMRRDIAWGEDSLDSLVGAAVECVYLIDPNCLISYFYSEYEAQGENIGDKDNTVQFSTPLAYFDMYQQGANSTSVLQYANDGVLEDARIDIRYQKACNTTLTKYGKPSLDHIWELDLVGLFDVVPKVGGNTGIIRVNKA